LKTVPILKVYHILELVSNFSYNLQYIIFQKAGNPALKNWSRNFFLNKRLFDQKNRFKWMPEQESVVFSR